MSSISVPLWLRRGSVLPSPPLRLGTSLVILPVMRTVKDSAGKEEKSTTGRSKGRPAPAAKSRTVRARPRAKRPKAPLPLAGEDPAGSLSEAQPARAVPKLSLESRPPKPAHEIGLPRSYEENHLLLLARDPQTLFAAWDMSPVTGESLRARLGRRAFAVSTLTLRLTRAGAKTHEVYVDRNSRSRYLKVDGGASFIAEIGFTTPSGRFEPVAHSAPCLVPVGGSVPPPPSKAGRRAVLSYRSAHRSADQPAVRRKQSLAIAPAAGSPIDGVSLPSVPVGAPLGARPEFSVRPVFADLPALPTSAFAAPNPPASRLGAAPVLGGASDLYRR